MSSPGCRRISVEWDIQDFEMFPKCHSTFPHSLQKRETPFHSKSRFSGFKFIAVSWPPPQPYRKFMVLGKFLAWQRNRERCFSSYHEHGPKKKTPSLHEESNPRPSDSALRCSNTEPQRLYGEQGSSRSSHMTSSPSGDKWYLLPTSVHFSGSIFILARSSG